MRYFVLAMMILPALVSAQSNRVEVVLDPTCVRDIGGVTKFDRNVFVTVHESFGSTDLTLEDSRYLEEELDARYGRDGGLLSWQAQETRADSMKKKMPDVRHIKQLAKKYRDEFGGPRMENPEHMREVVLCTHPERMCAMPDNEWAEWGPKTLDGAAEYYAQFMKYYFTDADRPKYLEVLNEPFVHAKEIGTTVEHMSEQHNVVAERVRELNPDVLVGGYTAAWMELESRDFGHWDSWMKTFIDIAGKNMDFLSYHIYDGVNVKGTPASRTGSNSEAIMDLMDSYCHIKLGETKPLMISEFGLIPGGNMDCMPYDAKRSADMLYSANGQLMTFMDHPDRFLKVIPFFLGKAEWTYSEDRQNDDANVFLLWRKLADGTYVETDLMLFYRFWKGVEGEWRKSVSSDPDVRIHFLADGNRMTLIAMNLDKELTKNVALSGLDSLKAGKVTKRTLLTDGDIPVLSEKEIEAVPEMLMLAPGESTMLFIDLAEPAKTSSRITESRHYATDYMKYIPADIPVAFKIHNVLPGKGTAVLRISAGRTKGRLVLPSKVEFNGQELEVPTNWAGDDQSGRNTFFGMIEVPVPMELVETNNKVKITYPDGGGKIACAVLQVNREGK